jgi:hypothetical protein
MAASRVFTLLVVLFALAYPALAQIALTETYVAGDGSYLFYYPEGWTVDDSDEFIRLISPTDDETTLIVLFYGPSAVATFAEDAADIAEVMEIAQASLEAINGETVAGESAGREMLVAEVVSESHEGLAYVINFGEGQYGLMIAATPAAPTEEQAALIGALADGFGIATGDVTRAIPSLTTSGGDWEATIGELQSLELIAPGGSLVFHEDSAFFQGNGSFFTPLARNEPFADVVMAADLTFTQGDASEIESCTLLARIGDNAAGDAETYVDVGLVTGGSVVVQDRFSATAEAASEIADLRLNLDEPHNLLLVLQNDLLDIYVDGELVFDDFLVADRSGSYGIALRSAARGARCEGENLWVYQTAPNAPGVCQIIAPDNANTRRGPGIQFDLYAQIAPGTTLEVIGQSVDGEGLTWWQLEDGNWVREDRVMIEGDCASVPVVE